MGMFSNPYYAVYWNKETPAFRHTTLCDSEEDLVRLISTQLAPKESDGRIFNFEVYEMVYLPTSEVSEILLNEGEEALAEKYEEAHG